MTHRELKTEVDEQRRLQHALRSAFDRSGDLQPAAEFPDRLRDLLQNEALRQRSTPMSRRSWMGLAAAVVLVAGLTGGLLIDRQNVSMQTLAEDARGDHRNCALKFRLIRMPIELPEAAAKLDEAFGLLMTAPADQVPTPDGVLQVLERHACAYHGRRFGHVVMQYQGHVVSLLLTAAAPYGADGAPRPIGDTANGLSVVSVNGSRHAVLMVSDLGRDQLQELSTIVALPLAQRLQGRTFSTNHDLVMALQTVLPVGLCLPRATTSQ
jgi:anti-sigma factor RsiW